ncbi:MAG: sigma-70 family RNA polymerase sigma factor [Planctomycetota bacterium]
MAKAGDDRVAKARAGDRIAQQQLWEAHRRWVATILLAHRGAGADLDDLLQDVAVVFVEHVAELRDPQRLRPWLRTVAINVARTHSRRERVRSRQVIELAADPADPRSDRDEAARLADEDAQVALTALDELPPDYREPILLRSMQGLSQRRIATVLGVPETTVENRLARGRKLLAQVLARRDGRAPTASGGGTSTFASDA